jgi:hypothetical protein
MISEDGIKYWGFPLAWVRKKLFSEIKSVDLLPYYKVFFMTLFFRYGLSTRKVPFRPFGEIVIIRLKYPNPIEYLFFAPKDATSFFEQLRQKMPDGNP